MGLKVLITSNEFWSRSGGTLYVRDVALELQRQGHTPAVYAVSIGKMAEELRAVGIQVTTRLRHLQDLPDVIHGHNFYATTDALEHFRTVPSIFICHHHEHPFDRPPRHPALRRYFGVSQLCVERLLGDGMQTQEVQLLPNFVDTARFLPRQALPQRPRKALVFSNYAHEGSHLPAVRAACRDAGLELDVIGAGVGKLIARPEHVLGQYDIVFAKAKAAMEAMAVGAAVVLCDFGGVGPMVTTAEFDALRPLNFGYQALRWPLASPHILREIARYDSHDAARVRDQIRARADLSSAVQELVNIYQDIIADTRMRAPVPACPALRHKMPRRWMRAFLILVRIWMRLPASWQTAFRQRPLLRLLMHGVREKLTARAAGS